MLGSGWLPGLAESSVRFVILCPGQSEWRAAQSADHRAVLDLLRGHVQFARRLAGALDGDPAAAALFRLALIAPAAVALVLSPVVAVVAVGRDVVGQEGEPGAYSAARVLLAVAAVEHRQARCVRDRKRRVLDQPA